VTQQYMSISGEMSVWLLVQCRMKSDISLSNISVICTTIQYKNLYRHCARYKFLYCIIVQITEIFDKDMSDFILRCGGRMQPVCNMCRKVPYGRVISPSSKKDGYLKVLTATRMPVLLVSQGSVLILY